MTIKEIWVSASVEQRSKMLTSIVEDGVSYATAYSWFTGKRTPKLLYRRHIARYVAEVTGVSAPVEELFSNKAE